MLRSLLYFLIAGICEIGGGYLVWISLREQRGIFYFIAGAAVLVLYGIVPTFQPASFEKSTPLTAVSLSSYLFYGVFG